MKLWNTWVVRYAFVGPVGALFWLRSTFGDEYILTEDPGLAASFGSRGAAIDARDWHGPVDGVKGKIVLRRGLYGKSLKEHERDERRFKAHEKAEKRRRGEPLPNSKSEERKV